MRLFFFYLSLVLFILLAVFSSPVFGQSTETLRPDTTLEFEDTTTGPVELENAEIVEVVEEFQSPLLRRFSDLLEDPRIPRYDFSPPLSVADSIYLIRCCIFILDENNRDYVKLDKEKLGLTLTTIINYIRLLDNRYSTLRHYRWIPLGKVRIDAGIQDEDKIVLNPTITNVSAISLTAHDQDLNLLELRVWDEQETEYLIKPRQALILKGRPAREVVFFNRQVRIARIESIAEVVGDKKDAHLHFEAGITALPEHIKYVIRELKQTREWVEADQLSEARQSLRNAWHYLLEFRYQKNI